MCCTVHMCQSLKYLLDQGYCPPSVQLSFIVCCCIPLHMNNFSAHQQHARRLQWPPQPRLKFKKSLQIFQTTSVLIPVLHLDRMGLHLMW